MVPSFSKKGYTGMASKSKRFGGVRRNNNPAPGAYDALGGFKAVMNRRDFSVGFSSGAFAQPIVVPGAAAHRRGHETAPGPGQYEIPDFTKEILRAGPSAGKRAPFLFSAQRAGLHKRPDPDDETGGGPAPWTYDPDAINRQVGAFTALNKKAPSAAFKSGTSRLLPHTKVDSIVESLKPHPSRGPSLGIHVDIRASGVAKPASAPGPGAYDPHARDEVVTLDSVRPPLFPPPYLLDTSRPSLVLSGPPRLPTHPS